MTNVGDRLDKLPQEDRLLRLQREFWVRATRFLQAHNGYDPQQADPARLPDYKLPNTIGFEMSMGDASRAPYRNNGKTFAFDFGASAAAAGGNNTQWYLGLQAPKGGQGLLYACVIIDQIVYRGASDASYGKSGQGAIAPAAANFNIPFAEDPPESLGNTGAGQAKDAVPLVPNLWEFFLIVGVPIATALFLPQGFLPATPAAGPGWVEQLGDFVLWPGELLFIQQDTVALAGRVSIKGRYIDFGSAIGSGGIVK